MNPRLVIVAGVVAALAFAGILAGFLTRGDSGSGGRDATADGVVAQDTGFPRHLPTGNGLLSFATAEEAAAAIEEIAGGYARHAAAARGLAEDLLDFRVVLPRLLDRLSSTSDDSPPIPGSAADTVS